MSSTIFRIWRVLVLSAVMLVAVAVSGCAGCDDGGDDGPSDAASDVMDVEDTAEDTEEDTVADTSEDADTGGDVEPDVTDADDTDAGDATADLMVRVFDLDGRAIEGADVEIGGSTQQTDSNGGTFFEDLDPGEIAIQVSADGYASTGAGTTVMEGTTSIQTLYVLEEGGSHSFDAGTDSTVFEDRVRLDIPANALQTEDGTSFDGTAVATITPLNPSTDQRSAFPRPMMGILEGDTEPTPFQSVLTANIELETQSGDALEVADGSSVRLEYVLPDDLQSEFSVGDQIEAYWYDEADGIWRQESQGEIIDSSYATDRLAWQVDVEHFTWWNCDEPWTDKNCVNVEVVEQGSGDPVEGAEIYVDGVSYNGTSYGTTGPNGQACVDFKLGSDAELQATGPNGRTQVGGAVSLTGTTTPAACSGAGDDCQEVTVELAPPTCLSGVVLDDQGSAVEDVDVRGVYAGANGNESATTTTDGNGEYCLEVPQGADVDVVASTQSSGTFLSGSESVTTATSAASCGGGTCTNVSDITLETAQTGCMSGTVEVEEPGGAVPAAAGTHVRAFIGSVRGDGAAGGDIEIDCSTAPSEWGTLLGSTTTDSNGNFCIELPVSPQELTILAGRCGSAGQECLAWRSGFTVEQAATCGGGSCNTELEQEPLFLFNDCGVGP